MSSMNGPGFTRNPFAAPKNTNGAPQAAGQRPPALPTGGAMDMSSYRPSNTAFADAWNASRPPDSKGVRFTPATSVIGEGLGNLAYAPANKRPQGLVMNAYDLQGNPTSIQGQQNQRDAFIAQIMQAPRSTPSYDFQGMLNNANGMVKDGWTNPFTSMIGGNAPPPDRQQAVRDLFTSSGIQAPPGFMDQLLGLLGQQSPPPQLPQRGQVPDPRNVSPYNQTGLSRPVGQRTMFRGDMGISEAHIGTEAFEREMREEASRPTPPYIFDPSRLQAPGRPSPQPPDRSPLIADVDRSIDDERRAPTGAKAVSYTPEQQAAGRLVEEMDRTDPTAWSPQQWAEYEQANRVWGDVYYGDVRFSRGAQGQVFDHSYGRKRPFDKNEKRFYGRAYRSDGTEILPQQLTTTAERPAPQTPSAATPIPTPPTGDTYPSTTQSLPPTPASTTRPTPLPPARPTVRLEDQAKAQQDAAARADWERRDGDRRRKAAAWAANNPNNWFMNPYMQDDPQVQAVRKRNPAVNKSGKGGGGSSPSTQMNFKGPPTEKRR